MSADCYWRLEMSAEDSEKYLTDILSVLYHIERLETDEGNRVFSAINKDKKTSIFSDNGKAHYIWGDNYLDPAPDIYIMIARAAPDAKWIVYYSSHALNGGDGCISFMEAEYANGILEFRKECYVDERTIPDLISEIKGLDDHRSVSFQEFCRYFNTNGSISEEYYNKYKDCVLYEDYDMGDFFIYNSETKTVRSNHLWENVRFAIE